MDLEKIDIINQKPGLYEKGDSVMWTDEHISKQLLNIHLNPEIDAASRIQPSIDNTIDLILKCCSKQRVNILDLGCGPGFYAEKLTCHGHKVTGVDFSENSIAYAKRWAKEKYLDIDYVCQDYLQLDYENQFDLVMIIYTDFGVLTPVEREKFLKNVHRALKPNGIFLFDVLNDKNIEQKLQMHNSWEFWKRGFWKNEPYLELVNGFSYSEENVLLKQHTIIDDSNSINIYRFWTHFFKNEKVIEILSEQGFGKVSKYEDILPASNLWNGENVTFYKTEKL